MNTIIDVKTLSAHLNDANWIILDARFSLADDSAGRKAYEKDHIPRAIYIDLNKQLSQPPITGQTGRHPLPDKNQWSETVKKLGISAKKQVVIYDDAGGAIASRAWWMLRWLGHSKVAVLDGGWPQWQVQNLPTSDEVMPPIATDINYDLNVSFVKIADAEIILSKKSVLIDARELPRFNGSTEPLDPVAGHIPGAVCSPFNDNLDDQGQFLDADVLNERLSKLINKQTNVICYCGSGVTACHNILAMKLAGLPEPALYPGSWSEWITNPSRAVATGEQ